MLRPAASPEAPVTGVFAGTYVIPTDAPEADATLKWSSTTLVTAEVAAGNCRGLGYTYGAAAVEHVIRELLAPLLIGQDALAIPRLARTMARQLRNVGQPGLAAMALSCVDAALWDLKARLLGLPLVHLLGACVEQVPIYGSGGFNSYEDDRLCDQLRGFVEALGCQQVKMKVAAESATDARRVAAARKAIGEAQLMVDANGGYSVQAALQAAHMLADEGVCWLEEPVSSDDIAGAAFVRARLPAGMELAAGEYVWRSYDALRLLQHETVDVLQLDATRCGGVSGFLQAAALAEAYHVPVSSHTAPALHLALGCSVPGFRHAEWFHDHARIEQWLFDGAPQPRNGTMQPDTARPGHGLDFKHKDAERFRA